MTKSNPSLKSLALALIVVGFAFMIPMWTGKVSHIPEVYLISAVCLILGAILFLLAFATDTVVKQQEHKRDFAAKQNRIEETIRNGARQTAGVRK